jgi:hypothetical protein
MARIFVNGVEVGGELSLKRIGMTDSYSIEDVRLEDLPPSQPSDKDKAGAKPVEK